MMYAHRVRIAIAPLALACVVVPTTHAQTVWSGLTLSFSKAAGTDGTLPANQDPLTANVVLTRLDSGGLINYVDEEFYTMNFSPSGTQWATDINNPGKTIAATNYNALAYTNWITAFNGQHTGGGSIANRAAVVHLVDDDIYLDLKFTTWSSGSGGGYAYLRAEPPAGLTPTGDYNGNGVVDAADYVLWRKTLNLSVDPAGSGADGDGDGNVNAGDYDFWRERFGNDVGDGAGFGSAVPEPTAGALALAACAAMRCVCRRRLERSRS